ncbi:MAG TPA: hypothetical protein VFG68_05470 [Fimbriiglobus sp.]|nr:hypothetical protein [Fimbriiglobus sp.]
MAIETQCPHCKKAYRLKDELAGKRVTCGNPDCRKAFTVDAKASANGKAAEPRIDAEAAAAAIFGDEPAQAAPEDQRQITMTCATCETKWDVPWSMQGKNVLCPDCRSRQRVPQQKTGKVDWRDSRAGRPTLARVEELEGVVGTVDVRQVSGKSLVEAGVIKEDIESRPRWHYVAWTVTALALVGVLTYGVMLLMRSNKEDRRDQFMADALKDVQETKDTGLPPAEVPLFKADIHIAAGEFALRKNDPAGLKAAIDHFTHARRDLEAAPPSAGRDLMLGELALAQVALGGSAEQVAAGTRVRWTPGGRQSLNEKTYTVQQELQATLKAMATAPADVRFHTIRRLARRLAQAGQPDVLSHSLIAQVLPQEHAEAVAQVAVEVLKATGDQGRAKAEAGALAPQLAAEAKGTGLPPSAPALFQAVGVSAPDKVKFPAPPGGGEVSDATRQTFVTQYLLQGKADEALDLAKKPGGTDAGRLSVLALAAEWADNPGPVVEAALAVLPTGEKRRKVTIPDLTLLRLAAQAGRANQPDAVEAFVKSISGDAHKAWAQAEALRLQLAASGEKPGEETQADAPASPKDARVGHARGRLALARHNARVTGNDPDASVRYDGWGAGTFRPFGLAGLALGLQDRNLK